MGLSVGGGSSGGGGVSTALAVGQVVKAMADANQVLVLAEYSLGVVRATGALTSDRTMTFPAPGSDADAYSKVVDNQCTGSNLVVSTGAGATFTLTPGTSALLIFDATVGVREAVR